MKGRIALCAVLLASGVAVAIGLIVFVNRLWVIFGPPA